MDTPTINTPTTCLWTFLNDYKNGAIFSLLMYDNISIRPYKMYIVCQVLYMYNSRTFIAHDMTKNSTVFTLNTPSWEIFQLSGKTLCSFEDVSH